MVLSVALSRGGKECEIGERLRNEGKAEPDSQALNLLGCCKEMGGREAGITRTRQISQGGRKGNSIA